MICRLHDEKAGECQPDVLAAGFGAVNGARNSLVTASLATKRDSSAAGDGPASLLDNAEAAKDVNSEATT